MDKFGKPVQRDFNHKMSHFVSPKEATSDYVYTPYIYSYSNAVLLTL